MTSPIVLANGFEDVETTARAQAICKTIGNALRKAYPRRRWYVDVNMQGGVAYVCEPDISMNYGFVLHLDKLVLTMEQAAIAAGGEILERFGLSRNKDAVEVNLVRGINGEAAAAKKGQI
jgi:hypothetical protein